MKKIKVIWHDALIYSPDVSNILDLEPPLKITEGELVTKDETGIILSNPYTTFKDNGGRDPREERDKKPTFIFIPQGMILKIE